MISVGNIMIASPATLTSLLRFWHSCPKIAPMPEKVSPNNKQTLVPGRFRLRFGSKMVTSLGTLEVETGLVRPNSIKFRSVVAAAFTYPIQQGIDQLVTCYR